MARKTNKEVDEMASQSYRKSHRGREEQVVICCFRPRRGFYVKSSLIAVIISFCARYNSGALLYWSKQPHGVFPTVIAPQRTKP